MSVFPRAFEDFDMLLTESFPEKATVEIPMRKSGGPSSFRQVIENHTHVTTLLSEIIIC